MSVLNITTDVTGKVVEVSIDEKVLEGVKEVSQTFAAGMLSATLKANFDTINVNKQASKPAPALSIVYAQGSVVGATKATITGEAGEGNHFAYTITDIAADVPFVDTEVTGAKTYASAADIASVAANKNVNMYELTSANKVVKFNTHKLVASEIKA